MKLLPILLLLALCTVEAQTVEPRCRQAEFSGKATQSQPFRQELGGGITFDVFPMRLQDDTRWGWFQIRVIGNDERGIFVFNPSDRNWLLATDFRSAFIGGVYSDVKAALAYRLRPFVFPISFDDKQELRDRALRLANATTSGEVRETVAALNSMALGQLTFEITDYRLSEGEQPMSVDTVNFNARIIMPPDFPLSEKLNASYINCSAIPEEVVENIRNPKRHDYSLPRQASTDGTSKDNR